MLEKQKRLDKTVKSWDKTKKEVESLHQIIGGARRKLDELADSHPEKIFIELGMFQADTFIQHILMKRTVDIVGNDTDFSVVAAEASCKSQVSV